VRYSFGKCVNFNLGISLSNSLTPKVWKLIVVFCILTERFIKFCTTDVVYLFCEQQTEHLIGLLVMKSVFLPSSFICLADYMLLHLLHVLSRNSLEDMVTALCTHYYFLPSDRCLHTTETHKKLEDTRPPGAPQVRLLWQCSVVLVFRHVGYVNPICPSVHNQGGSKCILLFMKFNIGSPYQKWI